MSQAAIGRQHYPVWWNLIRAGLEIGCGLYCIIQQFNTTRDTIFGLLQAGAQIPVGISAQQLFNFLNGNADKLNSIAFTVALVTQIVFWWIVYPETRNGHVSKLRKGFAVALFILDILSDIQYASNTQTIIGGDITRIFLIGNFGWLATLLFAVCTSFGSTWVLLNGIRVLSNVFEGTPD